MNGEDQGFSDDGARPFGSGDSAEHSHWSPEPSPWSPDAPVTPEGWVMPQFTPAPPAESGGMYLPGQGAHQPLTFTSPEPMPTATPRKRSRAAVAIALTIGLVGVAGGGAYTYTQLASEETPNTPEQAVRTFVDAVNNGDFIAMAQSMAPGERAIVFESVVPMLQELSRLEVLDKKLDLTKVSAPGSKPKVSIFSATTKVLRDDLVEVDVMGGLDKGFDPKNLPLGKYGKTVFGKNEAASSTDTPNALKSNKPVPVVVNKVGQRWYVSINYNIAEANRRSSEMPIPVPLKNGGVAPRGAESPDAAVAQMISAIGRADARRIIELLPPDEFAAMHDYSGRFINSVEKSGAEFRKIVDLRITPKVHSTKVADDRSMVFIDDLPSQLAVKYQGFTFDASYANRGLTGTFTSEDGSKGNATVTEKAAKGSYTSADGEKIEADYENDCLNLVYQGETKKGCGQKGIAKIFSDLSGYPINVGSLNPSGLGTKNKCAPNMAKAQIAMVAIQRDGMWFVSPIRTTLDSMTSIMKTLDAKAIECFKKTFQETQKSILGASDPFATDPQFQAPLDPASDPFAQPSDSTSVADTLPADDTFPPVDTLPVEESAGFDAPLDTIPVDTIPVDTIPVDTIPLADQAVTTLSAGALSFDDPAAAEPVTTFVTPGPAPTPADGPAVTIPSAPAPTKLVVSDVLVGTGDAIAAGDDIVVNYIGVTWGTKKQFDSTWKRAQPYSISGIGSAAVIEGWNKGLIGARVGGRRQLIVPAAMAFGTAGDGNLIGPNETLIFIVDIVQVTKH
jgi:peptidylprolyl isomerase